MPRTSYRVCRDRVIVRLAAIALAAPLSAMAALHVHEPFDYLAPSILAGTAVPGSNLAGAYVGSSVPPGFELRISAPGLSYGALAGAPSASGSKLTQLLGTTSADVTANLASAISVSPGEALFFSALFTLDDSSNGNHFASVSLVDGANGDELSFGETTVGIRNIRASARTAATGLPVATAAGVQFSNAQTLLLIGRYTNGATALGDRLELLGYDTAVAHILPAAFDPGDPGRAFYAALDDVDIDLTRISAVRFTIRGTDNNFIDELRVGSSYAAVAAIPEPHAWLLMVCGIVGVAAVTCSKRRRAPFCARDAVS